ncbi:GCG_CRPN prefix-to-repeats domain-containing protein [Aestuariivirga sp.]|uniref:GCG_CRPN prefix-to-repeats domain-containing protein n=1 Tax=Aestuariivirga sp. TaxID=2650926 RepID=UPI0039E40F01
MPVAHQSIQADQVQLAANGCGAGRYRGPNGACHPFGTGPYPKGYNGPIGHSFAVNHGCGAGRYRGPYGDCHKFGTGPYPKGYYGPFYK